MRGGYFLAGLTTAAIAFTRPAFAIPAPDLIVGSVSSLSQLLALLSVAVGGTAYAGTRIMKDPGSPGHARAARWLRWALVGALALLVASGGLNLYQWIDRNEERQVRLQANLTRPAREQGWRVVDPSMRELSYRQQEEHPLGISTDAVAEMLAAVKAGKRNDILFLDIRETVETNMGGIDGFLTMRFPDFWAAVYRKNIDLRDKLTIVLCHNGNRSHETAEDIVAEGHRARFMVGGFQKWFVEGRPIIGLANRVPETLRAITPYPNDKTLLDTPDVRRLIKEENALFVDVRYPLEFEDRHLPGAINVPIRKTPTPELKAMIEALPEGRPIIIPCYDRRGCFFGRILGHELHEAGFDFRGRYTLPFQYFEKKPLAQRLPHVAKWRALADQGPWEKAIVGLSKMLYWSIKRFDTILVGLFLLALGARLLVLPFSLKAERDQVAMRRLAPEIAELKRRLGDDPRRLTRAVKALYRRHGMTPARNLLVLLFLPIFVLSITAIELAAGLTTERFLWIDDLAAPDPLFVLPLAFAALVCLYVQISVPMGREARIAVWALGVPLLGAAMTQLSAAAGVYAAIAVLLVLAQQRATAHLLADRSPAAKRRRRRHGDVGVVPLEEAHLVEGTGGKAARLGRLAEAGFPVPAGLVLTSEVFDGH